jgi:hypothetical protein
MSNASATTTITRRPAGAFSRAATKFGAAAWSRSPLGALTELGAALHADADAIRVASTAHATGYVHAAARPATDQIRFL